MASRCEVFNSSAVCYSCSLLRKPSSYAAFSPRTRLASNNGARGTRLYVVAMTAVEAIEQEQMMSERPSTLLRDSEHDGSSADAPSSMRAKFEKMIRKAQDEICAAVEAVDGSSFREDSWVRPGGGGGISRVLQDGKVWEKAGVNVSVVYGTMPPEAYRAATSTSGAPLNKAGRVPFFASGISSVMHPKNPFAPTVHFNYRYFETDAPEGVSGAPRAWWFGGGTDLTPSYVFDEDAKHFHQRNDSWKKELKMAGQVEEIALLKAEVAEMSAVLVLPQVKDLLKTLAKGKEKGQEQGKKHDVNAHAVTEEGVPSKKPWDEDIPELSSPSYSPPTSFSSSSDSSSSSSIRRRNTLPDELPPERPEDHRIDLIPGSSTPNQPPYWVQKEACDKFDPEFHPRFKKWCDDYFLIKHRGERRGIGGIFFDDLNDRDPDEIFAFATECTNSVIPAYIPLINKRKDTPFNPEHKAWQQIRRGRYVEFNLVYDRGTTFGLRTGGRIESILMSLPLTARWEYDHCPQEGTEEWKLLNACKNPKDWL
ncbi:hypothetical protein L7F22_042776 [Adiantum nelumboides]|nr:hypothetical protein [Adiantum nelumboides]